MRQWGGNERADARGERNGPKRLPLAALALACLAAAGCEDEPAPSFPPGTVVAVDGVAIGAQEVVRDMAPVMLVEPQWNETQWKRLAFNELTLPRVLLSLSAGAEAREAARRSVEERFARIAGGNQPGPPTAAGALAEERSGYWQQLGLAAWGEAMNLAPGVWSDPIEAPGSFLRVRVLERIDGPAPAATQFRLDVIAQPYAPDALTRLKTDELLKSHRLTIVDPEWETIVPERTKFLMGSRQP